MRPRPLRTLHSNPASCFPRLLLLLTLTSLLTLSATAQVRRHGGGRDDFNEMGMPMGDSGSPLDNLRDVHAPGDSTQKEGVPVGHYVWRVDPVFGTIRPAQPDSMSHGFPQQAFTSGPQGDYNYLGNLGAPRTPRLLANMDLQGERRTDFLFMQPYDFFLPKMRELLFYNTRSPYTNLTYHSCGNKQNGEDRLTALFVVNSGKKLGMGFRIDYLYGRGYYPNSANSLFGGTLFTSYLGEHYQLHAAYNTNHMKTAENGGLEDDAYVTEPETFPTSYSTADMPMRLQKTWNRLGVSELMLQQRYSLGLTRYHDAEDKPVDLDRLCQQELATNPDYLRQPADTLRAALAPAAPAPDTFRAAADTTSTPAVRPAPAELSPEMKLSLVRQHLIDTLHLRAVFLPVTTFGHALSLRHNYRRFDCRLPRAQAEAYFAEEPLPADTANDLVRYFQLSNTVSVSLREGFNRWAKMGLRLYARHELRHFRLPEAPAATQDDAPTATSAPAAAPRSRRKDTENEFALGLCLLREEGRLFHYQALGELRTTGSDWGEFTLSAQAEAHLPMFADTLHIDLRGAAVSQAPQYFYRDYAGRNALWHNSFDKELRITAAARLRLRGTELGVDLASLQNLCYLQSLTYEPLGGKADGLPRYAVEARQASSNVQAMGVYLQQQAALGPLHAELRATYQLTSSETTLPLPKLNLYANLYFRFRLARVLQTELGADLRWFTRYYAPTYSPIMGLYALQDTADRLKVGQYPQVNVYANFQLQRTRFYVAASNVNYSKGAGQPFLVPHYPLNQRVLRIGISWNFIN